MINLGWLSMAVKIIFTALLLFISSALTAAEVPIYQFPLKNYSQRTADYLSPTAEDYKTPFLTPAYQRAQMKRFYRHMYQSNAKGLSPWSEPYVTQVLTTLKEKTLDLIKEYDNTGKDYLHRHYGENFKEHDSHWLSKIIENMDLAALEKLRFSKKHRAIVTQNTFARALPETAPDFLHFSQAGEGFPFDTLQESAVWVGTPLYVVSTSHDKQWSLVITPDQYFAWVKSNDIGYVSQDFVQQWQQSALRGLVAITKTDTAIFDTDHSFIATAHIGTVLPLHSESQHTVTVLVPSRAEGSATIIKSLINHNSASKMPLAATKENLSLLINELIGRPYGWGGNFFFNDCSQELKSLFTPLGLWLPRNSSKQATAGGELDLSQLSLSQRLHELKYKGKPLMTLIHLNGHVMLYLGIQKTGRFKGEAMTYQNIWGLAPASRDKRYVIGQSVFLPLLASYEEVPDATSPANKTNFSLIFLDKLTE